MWYLKGVQELTTPRGVDVAWVKALSSPQRPQRRSRGQNEKVVRIFIPERWTWVSDVLLWKASAPVRCPLHTPFSSCIFCSFIYPLG